MANTTKLKPRRVNSFNEPSDGKNLWYKNDDQFKWQDWWWWYQSFFKTQAEYDALPQSKESDNNLYIIVDTHLTPLTWEELEAMWYVDAKVYLDQHPLDYAKYYESTGYVSKRDYADSHYVVLPSWKYVYMYSGRYVDETFWPWSAYVFETNLTAQEVYDYFIGEISQDMIATIVSWEWYFDFGK